MRSFLSIVIAVLIVWFGAAPASAAEPPTVSAVEAYEQVKKNAADGVGGRRLASGVTVYDSDPFFFHVRAYGDSYCLDNFASGNGANNSPVGFWICNRGITEQWRWRYYSSTAYYGWELVNQASGRCLDYPESADGQLGWQFNVYDCKEGAAGGQTFRLYSNGSSLALASPVSQWYACLDGYSSRWQGSGSPVGLWRCDLNNPNDYQRWY
ncbi:RICIN domain-containing protein [Nonomuraea ceibae]|uniref:RICIN domain-containing protein n=1 Tax=Nonomuraea ceibae TaxID=1935170 RepID=UPI001C5F0613|nr:RICIN domain-containing protein [Nonomuraea ceibae]